ncbi:MAG: FAD-linked oxidase C-terminal domain-containing protein [Hyphomicrobiaceae bacterium]|jgi:glycolate oxidase
MSRLEFAPPDLKVLARREEVISRLVAMIGPRRTVSSPSELIAYETDALTAYRRIPLAVVLPESTEEVSAILSFCNSNSVKVIPRGAGTSLAGGAIPREDAIVISLARMNRILDVNYADRTIRVEAGTTNLNVTNAVSPRGFFYAPDPSSQLACTIGGNIANNSGGAHCLKYGVTTNNLLGVRMVLIDGTVLDIGGDHLDCGGLDLLGLVAGSEGQLGIVTEATLRILASAEGSRPVLFGFGSAEEAGQTVSGIIAAGIIPVAIEYMDKLAIEICESFAKAGYPLDVEALLIIEVEGSNDDMDEMLSRIRNIAEHCGVKVVRESQSAMESAAIWKGRKSAFGATGRVADYICMDGTVPLGQLGNVLQRTEEIVSRHGLRVANVFHAGDGNMHPLILYNANDPLEADKAEQAGNDILRVCVEAGGCLTGEHGVGIEKRDLMRFQFSEAELGQQMRVRAAFDPNWLLNPDKVFPLDGRPMPPAGE